MNGSVREFLDSLPRWAVYTLAGFGLIASGWLAKQTWDRVNGLESWSIQHQARTEAYREANDNAIRGFTDTLDDAVEEIQDLSEGLAIVRDRSDSEQRRQEHREHAR